MEAILKARIAQEQPSASLSQQSDQHTLGMATKAREHTQKMQQTRTANATKPKEGSR